MKRLLLVAMRHGGPTGLQRKTERRGGVHNKSVVEMIEQVTLWYQYNCTIAPKKYGRRKTIDPPLPVDFASSTTSIINKHPERNTMPWIKSQCVVQQVSSLLPP
jgi:hypothetical protein